MGIATDSAIFDQLAQTVIDGEREECIRLITEGLKRGMDPLEAVDKGLGRGIAKVGADFGSGVVFLPELTMAADVMTAAVAVLDQEIKASGATRAAAGKMVIGTIKGDIHDIGKSVVAAVLQANGYDVIDVGTDVDLETFVRAVVDNHVDVLGMSTLLTLPLMEMGRVIERLDKEGLRSDVKVIVGGCPVTEQFAKEIGADAVGFDAQDAVVKVDGLLRVDRSVVGAR
jgi:corrinoid protein of di/trimethylamine methyltransferase